MKRTKIITLLSVAALAFASVSGVLLYRTARAETPTATVQSAAENRGRGAGGYTTEELATALGISVDDLNAATQKAHAAALAQALEKGLVTQAQVDQLKANGKAFPFGGRWAGWLSQNGIDYEALLAKELGITVEKLQAAYQTAFYAHIDQAVTAGTLTQEQADLMKGAYARPAQQRRFPVHDAVRLRNRHQAGGLQGRDHPGTGRPDPEEPAEFQRGRQ